MRRFLPSPPRCAILLIGGFGRGEGGVHRNEAGILRAFNDYDLVTITDGSVDPQPLLSAAPALAEELDVDFVDFGFLSLEVLLGRPLDSIYAYELREGHRVLDGPPDILAAMPPVDPARLPLVEATRLLVNRGYGLVWARLELEAATGGAAPFSGRLRRFTINAIHKAVLAIGESILLAAGRFHVSYRERARRLADCPLPFAGPDAAVFRSAHAAATRFKLEPDVSRPPLEELGPLWEQVRAWHEATLRWIEERRLGRRFSDWNEWEDVTAREALAEAVRRPRRFLKSRASGVPGRRLRDAWLDRDRAFRIRLPDVLYGTSGARTDGAWSTSARQLVEAWHG